MTNCFICSVVKKCDHTALFCLSTLSEVINTDLQYLLYIICISATELILLQTIFKGNLIKCFYYLEQEKGNFIYRLQIQENEVAKFYYGSKVVSIDRL
jgi:hypothetical protein